MKLLGYKAIIICLTIIIQLSTCFAQSNIEKKQYETTFTLAAPLVDGKMNDKCWDLVEWSGNFTQTDPAENKPPSQDTKFKILYDNDNLYVFFRAFDTEPDKISKIVTRRDNFTGDMVEINIDSYFDKQTAFSFSVMASGAKGDEAITQDGNDWDSNWNPVWFLATSIDDKGWCAEIKIPFSQLRFGKKDEQVWGIQLSRRIYRLQERSAWQYIPKGSPGIVHLFGELHGILNIQPKRHLELLPYVLAKAERFEKEEGNPFKEGKSSAVSAGLDGKAGITNDFTLDFSINPDFGQVEADPSEVNLSAFETYFSEKRPFFVEGRNIYDFAPNQTAVISKFGGDNLFYSRRIGRYPHYYPDLAAGEYADMPESTTILGAAKLSGKTKKGLSIGLLESVTANEQAVIDSFGSRRKESVEPLTNYFEGRIKQDFNKGETTLGGVITAVNRDITNPALNDLPTSAYTGGIDFQHTWKERTWYVAGNAEFSDIHGKEAAVLNLQQSSARYYQRPDAHHLTLDSSLTSLSGYGGTVKFGRGSQKKLQFESSLTLRSPGLEFNDIGYMRYSDLIHQGSWVAYYIRNPFAIFNNFYLNTNYWMYWDFSGKLLSFNTNLNFSSQFKNRWGINGSFNRQNDYISTSQLRGGPSIRIPGDEGINLNLHTDQSKKLSFFAGCYFGIGDEASYRYNEYATELDIRPMNSLLVSVSSDFLQYRSILEYVRTIDNSADTKYLFADIDMQTLSMTFRINYTINPELSIEYYGQPFVSAGKYFNFKKITDPHADHLKESYYVFADKEISFNPEENSYTVDENNISNTYSFSNPDFNFRQFRSNLVLRWEYLPGSTLYLVWSQGRTSSASNGIFSYGNDMKTLFDITPHNIFLLKFSYWFSL